MTFLSISEAIMTLSRELLDRGQVVDSQSWQGTASPDRTLERQFVHLVAPIPDKLELIEKQTLPNMPWAVMHLSERLAGLPVNPGETYKIWPFYQNMRQGNDKFRTQEEKFTHTYMERFWPKYAGRGLEPRPDGITFEQFGLKPNGGIRYAYGDLNDVIKLMSRDPYTRQAYLPVWFPEDTGALQGRVPCTLGYLFLLRHGKLSISYHMRSCDAVRHFRDDIYLACGLLLHVLTQLKQTDKFWANVPPGWISMSIDSFHIFEKDKEGFIYNLRKFEKEHL